MQMGVIFTLSLYMCLNPQANLIFEMHIYEIICHWRGWLYIQIYQRPNECQWEWRLWRFPSCHGTSSAQCWSWRHLK